MKGNRVSYLLVRAINILCISNVNGTAMGILVGIILNSFRYIIASIFPFLESVGPFFYIPVGILIFNIKPFINNKYKDPYIEMKMAYLQRIIKEGNLTEADQRRIWRNFADSIISEDGQNTYTKNNRGKSQDPMLE